MSSDSIRQLKLNARDLANTPLARIPKKLARVAFIVCNTNRSYRQGNGVSPIERATLLASLFKDFGYEVFYIANPHIPLFVEYFKLFLQRTSQHLFFAFIGQGDETGTESLIFDDDAMEDDEFISLVNGYRFPGLEMTIFSDFTYDGSVFTRSEAYDSNTVLLTCFGDPSKEEASSQTFTAAVVRELSERKEITNQQLYDSLRVLLKRNGITLVVKSGDQAALNSAVIIYEPRVERNELIL